uniref:Uncharacterized protein n=1 Tax=Anguilla anguilla TaxID=7936 RepID=A0A0E9UQY8_ANGAN
MRLAIWYPMRACCLSGLRTHTQTHR